jgi:hypothetical protein
LPGHLDQLENQVSEVFKEFQSKVNPVKMDRRVTQVNLAKEDLWASLDHLEKRELKVKLFMVHPALLV